MTITTPTNAITINNGGGSTFTEQLSIAHDPALSPESWTIEAWIATEDGDSQFNRIIRQAVGGLQTYSLLVKDGQAHVRFDPGAVVQEGPNIADGLLHHLVGVYDAYEDALILYVDGVEVGRQDTTGQTPVQGTEPLEIGGITAATNQFFDGDIHEVRVWSEARTHREIVEGAEGVDPAAEPNLELQLTFPDGVPEDQSTNGFVVTTTGTLDPASAQIVDDDVFTPLDGVSVDFGDPGSGVFVRLTPTNLDIVFDASALGLGGTISRNGNGEITEIAIQGPETSINAFLASLEIQPLSAGGARLILQANTVGQNDTVTETITFNGALDAEAQSLVVTTLDDVVDLLDGETSLREALDFANSETDALGDGLPDTITFDPSLQGGTLVLTQGMLEVTDDVTISGDVTIDGDDSTQVLRIVSGTATLEDITLSDGSIGGSSPEGGNLFVAAAAAAVLEDVSIMSGYATLGGGAGIFNAGSLMMSGGRIDDNRSYSGAAAIYSTGSTILDGVTIEGNYSTYGFGAIAQSGGALTVLNSVLSSNQTGALGYDGGSDSQSGAISAINGATVEVSNSLISENAAYGVRTGGIYIELGSAVTAVNTTFFGNTSESGTGSVFNNRGELSLIHATVTNGVGQVAGGVRSVDTGNSSETEIRNSILLGNRRTSDGVRTDLLASGAVDLQGVNIHSGQMFDGAAVVDPIVLASEVFDAPLNAAGTLADNGGPLRTVLILDGGKAHNVATAPATPDATDVDQDGNTVEDLPTEARGGLRLVGGTFDLGAVELSEATSGNDIVFSISANRTAVGLGGDDTVVGSGEDDALSGNTGDDIVYGGSGDDFMQGQGGNDTLHGGDGNDDISGGVDDDMVYGGDDNDILHGQGGEDALYGGSGNDDVFGGAGNDTLAGGDGEDSLSGGTGIDTVTYADASSGVEIHLDNAVAAIGAAVGDTFASVENAVGSALYDVLIGSSLDNTIHGGAGDDHLDGVAGNNTLAGGLGDDVYIVNTLSDQVNESANEGTDQIRTALSFTLGANVENLALLGSGDVDGTGSNTANEILGNAGNNTLLGNGGNDTLDGGAGDDLINGGTGADAMSGGLGDDI
ncbi:MAG: LamG-like jellyroll fold domain-containing protein, partial [Pseudomonadota bacterium]